MHDEPGVTRDRVYGHVEWGGLLFSIVDTGGFVAHSADRFEAAIREQVHLAMEEADLPLLMAAFGKALVAGVHGDAFTYTVSSNST